MQLFIIRAMDLIGSSTIEFSQSKEIVPFKKNHFGLWSKTLFSFPNPKPQT